jgi:hypothetical protein
VTLTERDLFAAYRGGDGRYYADCACGGTIISSASDANLVAEAIDAHHLELQHVEWRREQLAVEALKRPTRHPCPCCGGELT